MTERSARFALPFILPGQAQKEVFHNEALVLIDGLVHAAVEGALAAPPPNPEEGACWIVAAGASGDWTDRDDAVALASAGGWRFLDAVPGMILWDKGAGHFRYWTGAEWSDGSLPAAGLIVDGDQVVGPRQPDVPSPSGGTTIDAEARAAIGAIIVTLKSHGLID